jgi:hypothetical protein
LLSNNTVSEPQGSQEKIVKSSSFVVSLCALVLLSGIVYAAPSDEGATAQASPAKGNMLVAADGARLAPIYRLSSDGSPQIILDGKLVTVPAASLSMAGGRLMTSLTKREVLTLH